MLFIVYNGSSYKKEEELSQKLVEQFHITKLYQTEELPYTAQKALSNSLIQAPVSIIGLIEIPTISVHYSILSQMDEELLKISPCRFYGPYHANEIGNLCIAGHNYDNHRFFSNLRQLQNGDSIFITDQWNQRKEYQVYHKYETYTNDIECTNQDTNGKREITLVTCNNVNGNRLIIKAREIF